MPFLVAGTLPPFMMVLQASLRPRRPLAHNSLAKQPPPNTAAMCRRLRRISTLSLFIPAIACFLISAKWTNFDIGVTIWLQSEFGYSIARASLAFTCASLAYAIFSPVSCVAGLPPLPAPHRRPAGRPGSQAGRQTDREGGRQ